MGLPFLSSRVCVSTDNLPSSFTLTLQQFLTLMTNINVATATRLDLEIADTQGRIKYTVLPTRKPRKSLLVMTQTKGLRTNTNRQGQSTPQAAIV